MTNLQTWETLTTRTQLINERGDALNKRYDRAPDGSDEKQTVMEELDRLSRDRNALQKDIDAKCDAEGV